MASDATAALAVGGVTAALTAAYLWSRPQKITCEVDLNKQSKISEDGIYASALLEDTTKLIEYLGPNLTTTYECFMNGLQISRHQPFLGERTGPNKEYEWKTYQQCHDRAQRIGSGFLKLGIEPASENVICLYCSNRIEWTLIDLGCSMYTVVIAALYDTLGSESSTFIINQTECSLVVCENEAKMEKLFRAGENLKNVKCMVLVQPTTTDYKDLVKDKGIEIYTLAEVEALGEDNLREAVPPKPDDLFAICYTSGSTGIPKGVMTTHRNVTSFLGAIARLFSPHDPYCKDTVNISYLPLPHVFERMNQHLTFAMGGRIGFFQGDIKQLFDDVKELKPTLFPTVPRLLNRIYEKIHLEVSKSAVKTMLLKWALASKKEDANRMVVRKNTIWDLLVFRNIRNLFGGNVNCLLTGSAPLSENVLGFFRAALGCLVTEAYGQTEATAAVTMTVPGETTAGHVGPPLPCNYLKLVDVPELGYFEAEGKGEVCVKGTNVTSGYYKLPEKTAEIIDSEGWLHTQDIGMWLPNGTLKIIDRKKNIFKLAQGEYVAPEKNENVYSQCPLVAQVYIDGHSLEAYTMGIVVPDEEVLKLWAKSKNMSESFSQLCEIKEVKEYILQEMLKFGKLGGLHGFEQVKDIFLCSEMFSIENGLLSPTMKNTRASLRKHFESHITELYRAQKS